MTVFNKVLMNERVNGLIIKVTKCQIQKYRPLSFRLKEAALSSEGLDS